jgi:hypothetical protein
VLLGEVAQWPLQLPCRVCFNGMPALENVLVEVTRHLQRSCGFWTYRVAGLAPHVGGAACPAMPRPVRPCAARRAGELHTEGCGCQSVAAAV